MPSCPSANSHCSSSIDIVADFVRFVQERTDNSQPSLLGPQRILRAKTSQTLQFSGAPRLAEVACLARICRTRLASARVGYPHTLCSACNDLFTAG